MCATSASPAAVRAAQDRYGRSGAASLAEAIIGVQYRSAGQTLLDARRRAALDPPALQGVEVVRQ